MIPWFRSIAPSLPSSSGPSSTLGKPSARRADDQLIRESAYLKAFLLRIREGLTYTSQLRRYLLLHPLLVIELGFRLAA